MTFATDLHKPGSRSPIAHSVLLIVEGYDTFAVVVALLGELGLAQTVEVRNGGGTNDLLNHLRILPALSGFAQVAALGVIRDCENDPVRAFRDVQLALKAASLAAPAAPRQLSGASPDTGIFLLPDESTPGMLESLLWKSIAAHPVAPCVDDFLNCVTQKTGSAPTHPEKSRVYSYIAGRERPHLLLGQAARAGYFPWTSPVFDSLKDFLRALAAKAAP